MRARGSLIIRTYLNCFGEDKMYGTMSVIRFHDLTSATTRHAPCSIYLRATSRVANRPAPKWFNMGLTKGLFIKVASFFEMKKVQKKKHEAKTIEYLKPTVPLKYLHLQAISSFLSVDSGLILALHQLLQDCLRKRERQERMEHQSQLINIATAFFIYQPETSFLSHRRERLFIVLCWSSLCVCVWDTAKHL